MRFVIILCEQQTQSSLRFMCLECRSLPLGCAHTFRSHGRRGSISFACAPLQKASKQTRTFSKTSRSWLLWCALRGQCQAPSAPGPLCVYTVASWQGHFYPIRAFGLDLLDVLNQGNTILATTDQASTWPGSCRDSSTPKEELCRLRRTTILEVEPFLNEL